LIEFDRIFYRLFYGAFGDFIKAGAMYARALGLAGIFYFLGNMPSYRFAFAVWIGRQIDIGNLFGLVGYLL